MIVGKIYLYLNTLDFKRETASDFLFSTSFVTYFVNRHLKKAKFQSPNFKKIGFVLSKNPREPFCDDKFLTIELLADLDVYDHLTSVEEKGDYFVAKITEGLKKARNKFDIPEEEILTSLKLLKDLGYKNEWIYKSKKFKEKEITAELSCSLDIESFRLILKTFASDKLISENLVLQTKPDELIYDHKFKDLIVKNGMLLITDKFDNVVFEKTV